MYGLPIGLGTKGRIAGFLCSRPVGIALARIFADRIPSRGFRFDTSHPSLRPEVKARIFWGLYERSELRFIQKYMRPDLDVVELGSGLGVTSCHVRKRIDPSRRLICIEADPQRTDSLWRNLQINGLTGGVLILTRAVGYRGQREDPSQVSAIEGEGEVMARPVTSMSLSAVLSEYGIEEYGMVCDIEGAEAGIIAEDREALHQCRQLIIELHESCIGEEVVSVEAHLSRLVDDNGFRPIDRHGAVCVLGR